MSSARRVLLLLLFLLVSACAPFAAMQGNLAQHVESLIADRKYSQALRALDYGRDDSPEYATYQSQRKRVLELTRAYEQELSDKAEKHRTQKEWSKWRDLIVDAERSIPDSPVFQGEKQKFDIVRAAERDRLELSRLLVEGEWLLQAVPLHETMATLVPEENEVGIRLRDGRARAVEVARLLTPYGYQALEREDLDQAQRILPMAMRLNPDQELAAANARLNEKLKERKARQEQEQRRARQEQEQRNFEKLLQSIESAFHAQDLVKGQGLLAQAEALGKDDPRYKDLRARFDKAAAEAISRYQEEGIFLYSQGKFEQALASWKRVLSLDPNNEQAQVNIIRAERVLEKLQRLREKQVK